MDNSLPTTEFQIPEFKKLCSKLKCEQCTYYCVNGLKVRNGEEPSYLPSKYYCEKFLKRISILITIIEIALFILSASFAWVHFGGFWITVLKLVITFGGLLIFDFFSDRLIELICNSSEKKRKNKYDIKVQNLKKENEAIQKANAGITQEMQEFLDNSKSLFNGLNHIADSIKDYVYIYDEKVSIKFEAVLKELKFLNEKLYKDTFESSYISTLYEIHLPKLLEYSTEFLNYLNSNTLTEKQIVEFIKLLEVFRVKISSHTKYIQNKVEDNFIIKMTALNQDVIPDYDGNEEQNDE